MSKNRAVTVLIAASLLAALVLPASASDRASLLPVMAPMSGAIWTTDSTCSEVNLNLFASKQDVYINGGPRHPGAAGLPSNRYYYVKVTEPNGTLLGYSPSAFVYVGDDGKFADCYQLWEHLIDPDGNQGYWDTGNPGGVYKVWLSEFAHFPNDQSKTDNFKVMENPPEPVELCVEKFYDANANGLNDDGQPITGWEVTIEDEWGDQWVVYTPECLLLPPGDYCVTESYPVEPNWMPTTPNPVCVTLGTEAEGVVQETVTVEFGNLCLGPGGAYTLGFWSNKNGRSYFGDDDLALMVSLNLRKENGDHFDPISYTQFRAWLLRATAANMAYMLSAQLAAMELNVFNGFVDGNALIYAPGTQSANELGFATVNDVMAEADYELGLHGLVRDGSPYREYQEALKDALDNANNNMSFVQPVPCPFSFAP